MRPRPDNEPCHTNTRRPAGGRSRCSRWTHRSASGDPFAGSRPEQTTESWLLVHGHVRAAETRERLAPPPGPAVPQGHSCEARHEVELGRPRVAKLDGKRL